MTLTDVLDTAATTDGVTGERGADGSTEWSGERGAFAVLSADGRTVSFRLDATIAAAAVRTPDTTTSARGPDWVDFTPVDVDGHAADRAIAWFAAASRRSST